MHLLLTDRLTCPRCGPEFGLILLAEHIQDRRVLEGEIGCANCRERFLIRGGFADLTWPPSGAGGQTPAAAEPTAEAPDAEDREAALRVAALLGITSGPGHVLLMGANVRHAASLADLLVDIEWIALDGQARQLPDRERVSRIGAAPERIPFFTGVFRGAVLDAAVGTAVGEVIRVLASGARVVLVDPPKGARAVLEDAGLTVILDDRTTLVAARGGSGSGVASASPRD